EAARGDGEVADQSRAYRARPPDPQAARAAGRHPEDRSVRMNLSTDRNQGVSVVRVNETRLMYPLLSEFSNTISGLIGNGEQKVLLDLSTVTYVDSATIGCLMDLYRQATAAGGALKLSGVQRRVETMLTMTGAQNFLEIHPDEASALRSFGV